jgi:hypothetical protein
MPLFDPAAVPPDVVNPKGVAFVNEIYDHMRSRLLTDIIFAEPGSGFRLSNMIRSYTQNHLRRALMFLEASHQMILGTMGLVSLTCTRSVFETVANYCDFEKKLHRLLDSGDIDAIHKFVHTRAFSTRKAHLIEQHQEPRLQALSILTQIDAMKDVRPSIRDDYDHLSEFVHPNGIGSTLYFQEFVAPEVGAFRDQGIEADELKWALIGGSVLGHMADAITRVEARLPALSELGAKLKDHGSEESWRSRDCDRRIREQC